MKYLLERHDGETTEYYGFESECQLSELEDKCRLIIAPIMLSGEHGEFQWFGKSHRIYSTLYTYRILSLDSFWNESVNR